MAQGSGLRSPLSPVALICLRILAFSVTCAPALADNVPPGPGTSPPPGVTVYYGGQFSPEQAELLAWATAWLRGLEETSLLLSETSVVRLAGLDDLQRQGLAALLSVPRVTLKREEFSLADPGGPEPKAVAIYSLYPIDRNEIPLWIGQLEQRRRQAEVIAVLWHLVPEALELANKGHLLRLGAVSLDPGRQSSVQNPDAVVSMRLNKLLSRLEAYTLYLKTLRNYVGVWENPEEALSMLGAALALSPGELPILVSQGEILLHLDRPSAALRSLESLAYPSDPLPPGWKERKNSPPDEQEGRRLEQMRQTALSLYVRGLRLRALAQLRAGHAALAEKDLNTALELAPERAELWLARGALKQAARQYDAMCSDYHKACALGLCDGLKAAREQNLCGEAR